MGASGAHPIFLPPYSPDLNPIEQVFANLKHLLCKVLWRRLKSRGLEARCELWQNGRNFASVQKRSITRRRTSAAGQNRRLADDHRPRYAIKIGDRHCSRGRVRCFSARRSA
jgi:hypothetical protein